MAKKRKTLPKEFGGLVETGTLEELCQIMGRCLPNAVGGYNKYNAFGFPGITEPFARWLLEYGTDINCPDSFGYTPLHNQAMRRDGTEQVALYLRLGADVNGQFGLNGGPLHGAADGGCLENAKLLIAHGADLSITDHWGDNALEFLLCRAGGWGIVDKVDTVELLLESGMPVTEKAKKYVEKIGEEIEFRRDSFSEDMVSDVDRALSRLYRLLGVPPVPKCRKHDGKSAITVSAGTWQEQYQELWDYLVPGSGPCKTLQGEVIRINGRVRHELLGNGGMNWDKDYRRMLKSLGGYLSSGVPLPEENLEEAKGLAEALRPGGIQEAALERLCQLSVQWALKNQQPIPFGNPPYQR